MLGPHTESRMQGSGAQTQHPVLLGDADQSPGGATGSGSQRMCHHFLQAKGTH